MTQKLFIKDNLIQQKYKKLMKVLSPFGPKIAVIKIPSNLVKKINDEVESIIKDKKKLTSVAGLPVGVAAADKCRPADPGFWRCYRCHGEPPPAFKC